MHGQLDDHTLGPSHYNTQAFLSREAGKVYLALTLLMSKATRTSKAMSARCPSALSFTCRAGYAELLSHDETLENAQLNLHHGEAVADTYTFIIIPSSRSR